MKVSVYRSYRVSTFSFFLVLLFFSFFFLFHTPKYVIEIRIASLITILITLSYLYWKNEILFSNITIDDDGITYTCLFRKRIFLSWESVVDSGIGVLPERGRDKAGVYFSRKQMHENELMNIFVLKHTESFLWAQLSEKLLDEVMKHCDNISHYDLIENNNLKISKF